MTWLQFMVSLAMLLLKPMVSSISSVRGNVTHLGAVVVLSQGSALSPHSVHCKRMMLIKGIIFLEGAVIDMRASAL